MSSEVQYWPFQQVIYDMHWCGWGYGRKLHLFGGWVRVHSRNQQLCTDGQLCLNIPLLPHISYHISYDINLLFRSILATDQNSNLRLLIITKLWCHKNPGTAQKGDASFFSSLLKNICWIFSTCSFQFIYDSTFQCRSSISTLLLSGVP